jgi:hypothetical protein
MRKSTVNHHNTQNPPLMQNKLISITRILCICLTGLSIIRVHAQTEISDPIFNYYSDSELYQNGYKAYQENDFAAAALYLYAYAQRHEEILNGPGSQEKAEFYIALVYTTRHLHAVVHQKADDPYGREYVPLDKSYFDNKPSLPKSISLNGEVEAAPNKDVKFRVFITQEPGDEPLSDEAVVVRYDVKLHPSGTSFKVTDIHTEFTGNGGKSPAVFTIRPGEMAYFEAYKSLADVKKVSKEKIAQKWTVPPFKNFGKDSTRLCKTNYFDTNTQQINSCYTSLTLGYSKANTEIKPDKEAPQPIALFTTDKTACFPPCTIKCTNQSRDADKYVWMVDGKIASREKNFAYTIKNTDGHRIKLTAYKGNLSDEYEVSVKGLGE